MEHLVLTSVLLVSILLISGCLTPFTAKSENNLPKRVSLEETTDTSEYGVIFNLSIVESVINKNHTATFVVHATNVGDRTIKLGTGGSRDVFTDLYDNKEDLILVPNRTEGPKNAVYKKEQDCWRHRSAYAYFQGRDSPHNLAPNETRSMTVKVVSPRDTGSCLPSGRYSFEQEYVIHKTTNQNETTRFTWGFDVHIEDIDPEG